MPRPKNRTSRQQIKPLGVSERLGHAPPTRYRHGSTGAVRPAKTDTYTLAGVVHTYDGACHPECENVR